MQMTFSRDLADQNQPIFAAFRERPSLPLRIRVQPMILRRREPPRGSQYESWKDVNWNIECDTIEEAFAFREALRLFFHALVELGPVQLVRGLRMLRGDHAREVLNGVAAHGLIEGAVDGR